LFSLFFVLIHIDSLVVACPFEFVYFNGESELIGMVEYDSVEGKHMIVNLKPVRIVA
jgi:hypothetical protein